MAAVPSIGRADRVAPPAAPEADLTRALYERHANQIFRYCLHQLGSREEAEDAVQSTFLNAFRGIKRGVVPELETAWLFKIAENVCLSRRRSTWRRDRIESPADFDVVEEVTPAPGRLADELIGLQDVLEQMPENQRRAILLREWQGLSYHEIADELELSQSAVETLIFRARRSLAQGLEQPPEPARKRRAIRGADWGNMLAGLKSMLLGGGAAVKVAAAVAVVSASTVVAAAPVQHRPSHAHRTTTPVTPARVAPSAPAVSQQVRPVPTFAGPIALRRRAPAPTAPVPPATPTPGPLPTLDMSPSASAPAPATDDATAPPAPASDDAPAAPPPAAPPASTGGSHGHGTGGKAPAPPAGGTTSAPGTSGTTASPPSDPPGGTGSPVTPASPTLSDQSQTVGRGQSDQGEGQGQGGGSSRGWGAGQGQSGGQGQGNGQDQSQPAPASSGGDGDASGGGHYSGGPVTSQVPEQPYSPPASAPNPGSTGGSGNGGQGFGQGQGGGQSQGHGDGQGQGGGQGHANGSGHGGGAGHGH